ncbi:MAG: Zn-ribbon domain-containing OB-fold protein [Thaumarchaeota archaeon]|nr:Zn-ribbon domain-containing OB-fold protein [Nitrososphaerota archaeon]
MESEPLTLHSRKSLNLRYNVPISKTSRFWDGLKEGKFVTTKCKSCGEVSFPPQADCPKCMSGEAEWVDMGTDGELLTFTYVQVTPTSFVESDPYTVAVCRLPGGQKVLAWTEGLTREQLKVGMKLRLEARTRSEGSPYYVFVLR